jgi:hemolysin activation/secretion protein
MLKKIFVLFMALALLSCLSENSWAQTSSLEILDRERARTQPAPRSQPQLRIEEDRQPSPVDATIQFVLKSIVIEGATVFPADEFQTSYLQFYNQRISFETLNAITAELTKKYRDQGYLLSRVILPAQDVDQQAAEIRLLAIEGFIASIQYEGDADLVAMFKKRFSAVEQKLLEKKPLKHADFEREMLLLQDLPGLKVSSRFQEAPVQSGSILVLELEKKALSGNVSLSNSGTGSAGPGLISASVSLNSLPLLGLSSTVYYSQAAHIKEYFSITLSEAYQFVNGLTVSASYAHSYSPEPDTDFARLFDYKTKGKTLNLNVTYPLIRSRDLNLSLGLGYEHRNSDSDLLGEHYNHDRLRTLSFNTNFDFSDEVGGVTQLIATISQGLDVFGATNHDPESTNPLAGAKFIKGDIYFSRNQQLPLNLSFLLAAELMVSDSVLSSYNKFSFGGGQFGRGYDSGTIEGDNAFAISFEPRWTHYFNDKLTLQPFAFIDYGVVWTNQSLPETPSREHGASFGGGLRFWGHVGSDKLPDFNLSAFVGKSLKKIDEENSTKFVVQATFIF